MRRLGTVFFLLLLSTLAAPLVFGRAGGGHSYSSGHSYSGGSGFSGSSYSGSGSSGLIDAYIAFVIMKPLFGIPFTIFLIYVAYSFGLVGQTRYISSTISAGAEAQSDLSLRKNLAVLTARDPAFDVKAFLGRVENAFLKIQDAWSSQDMAPARAFITDGVMERFSIQLDMNKADNRRNNMADVTVTEASLLQAESDEYFDTIHVEIRAEAIDTDVSADGTVVRGDGSKAAFSEVWTFLRRPGAKTLKKPGLIEGFCPNCGAPLAIADAARCDACKSWVNSGQYDWVLSKITQTCEWGVRDPEHDVPGLGLLAESDPELNVQFLEDRASAAFWRWQSALLRGDAAAARAVATQTFCRQLTEYIAARPISYREAAVGTVVVLAFEPGEDFDRAHVVVRWSGAAREGDDVEQVSRQDVLILGRKPGVRTDVRVGLRSLVCPSCGAPPVQRDLDKCEYCGTAFNDGSRQWVLVGMQPAAEWTMPLQLDSNAELPVLLDWSTNLVPADAFAVMTAAMLADGRIDPRERAYLETYARQRGIPPEKTSSLIAAAQAGQLAAPQPRSAEEAENILRGLMQMSFADGRVTNEEIRMLIAFAGRLSMAEKEVRAMLKEERTALYRKAKGSIAAAKAAVARPA